MKKFEIGDRVRITAMGARRADLDISLVCNGRIAYIGDTNTNRYPYKVEFEGRVVGECNYAYFSEYELEPVIPYKNLTFHRTGDTSSLINAYVCNDIAVTRSAYELYKKPNTIENVIFNDPATIVFWADGTKTVVKAHGDDIFDPEKGLAMAIAKKAMGNKGNYCNELKKWLPKEEKADEEFDRENR